MTHLPEVLYLIRKFSLGSFPRPIPSLTPTSIRSIAWNPTGHLIATGSVNKTLRIWNPEKPEVKNSTELRGHTGGIECVSWNPVKEAELASVSNDGTCKFWDVRSKGCIETVQLGGAGLTVSWAADGSMVVAGNKDDALIPISLPDFTPLPTAPQHIQTNQTIFPHTSSPSSILITSGDGSVKIASFPSLSTLHTLHAHTSACTCLQLSPNGRYLATGGNDALICLWDTTEWVCRRSLSGMVGAVRGLGFSWDGSYVVGGSDEGNGLEIVSLARNSSPFFVIFRRLWVISRTRMGDH
ncbi:hypothetical protein MMC20_007748 [Loxospora ochrophaea]|nr:hypothetical protein [Loxospora ochrophaea]